MIDQALYQQTERAWQFICGVFDELRHMLGNARDTPWDHETEFPEQPANLIRLRSAGPHEPLTGAV